jgi:hypothetical protein
MLIALQLPKMPTFNGKQHDAQVWKKKAVLPLSKLMNSREI